MARGRKSNSIKQSDFTNSTNPQDLERRLFVGNLPTDHMTREEMEEIFSKYGKIRGQYIILRLIVAGKTVRNLTFMLVECYLMMVRGVTNVAPKK